MRTIRRTYVDIPEGQIHLHCSEGEDPPIVFLHQTASSARTYDALFAVIPVANRLISLDTPGFGFSFPPEGWPTLETYAGQLLAALDAFGVERFHLYGHHTGASLGIEMAAHQPERVLSLMLSGPGLLSEEERAAFIPAYREPIMPQRDGSHLMRNWNYSAVHNPNCDVELLQEGVVDLLRAWRARPQAYMAYAHHATAERAAQVRSPVLLLTTDTDFFHGTFDRARALFPDATIATTGGDNYPFRAVPEQVGDAIARFMSTVGTEVPPGDGPVRFVGLTEQTKRVAVTEDWE